MPFLALIPALLSGWFKTALGFLSSLPREVWYILAGVLAFLFVWHLVSQHEKAVWNDGFNAGWAVEHRQLVAEQKAHAVTRASLKTALNAIDDQNRAVDQLATETKSRLAASVAARLEAQKAAQKAETTARALDASASAIGAKDAPCVPSKAFLDHSGEL